MLNSRKGLQVQCPPLNTVISFAQSPDSIFLKDVAVSEETQCVIKLSKHVLLRRAVDPPFFLVRMPVIARSGCQLLPDLDASYCQIKGGADPIQLTSLKA